MGNSHKKPQQYDFVNQFVKTQWARQEDIGKCELWLNVKSNELCQAYRLNNFPSSQDFQRYEFRHHNNKDIVKLMFVDIEKSSNICSGNDQAIVLTQHIPVRLSQLNNISVPQGFSILKSTYQGFNIISSFYGPIHIDQDMIGFNMQGKTKVWLNHNYSKNYAQKLTIQNNVNHIDKVGQNDNEVQHIFEIVQERIVGKKFPVKFREGMYGNKFNYFQASNFVDQFCQSERLSYPQRIQTSKYLKISKNNITSGNNTSQMILEQKNMTLVKSNSVNSLATQNRAPTLTLLRQNTEQKTLFVPSHNSTTILSPNFQKNVVFGNRRVNVTFGSPNILKNQVLKQKITTIQNRPSLPNLHQHQSIKKVIIQAPPIRENLSSVHLQTTPKYVGNNLKFVSPGKITQFQQPIYRQIVRTQTQQIQPIGQEKKIHIAKAEITQSQNIKIQVNNNNKQSSYNQLENQQGKNEQINELHKYLDKQVLKYPHQEQFQMANSFGVSSNYNNMHYQQHQIDHNDNDHSQQFEDQDYQQEVHANQYNQYDHEYEHQPHHQCQILPKIENKISKDSNNDYYHYEQHQHESQQLNHNQELNQIEREFHQKHSDYDQDQDQVPLDHQQVGQQHLQYLHQDQHMNINNVNVNDYHYPEEQTHNNTHHNHNEPYYHNGNDEEQEFNHQHAYEQNRFDQQQENNHLNHHQNYLSSQQIIPPHQPEEQSEYYYHQFKKYATQKPSSPSHIKHESNYQNQLAIKHSSRSGTNTNRDIQTKSTGTLIVHESKENLYNVSNNLSKNVTPNHSNQYKQVDSQGEMQMQQNQHLHQHENQHINPHRQHQHQHQHQHNPPAQKMHYRQESDQFVQYTPVDSVFKKGQQRETDQINKLDRPEDIQKYIKNKYKDYIGSQQQTVINTNNQRKTSQTGRTLTFARQPQHEHGLAEFATNVQSKYQVYQTFVPTNHAKFGRQIENIHENSTKQNHFDKVQGDDLDFLDIKNLQKSLDQKYSKLSHQQKIKAKKSQTSEQGFDVASLEKKLEKFQQNRQSQSIVKSNQFQKSQDFFKGDDIIAMMDKRIQQSQRKNNKQTDPLNNVKLQQSVSGSIPISQIPVLKYYDVEGSSRQNSGRQYSSINNKMTRGYEYEDTINKSGTSNFQKNKPSTYDNYSNSYITQKYTTKPIDKYNSTSSYGENYQYADFKKKPSIKNLNLTSNYGNDYKSGYDENSRRSSRRQSAKDALKLANQIQDKYEKYVKKSSSHIQNSLDSIKLNSKYDTDSYLSDPQLDTNSIKQRTLNRKKSPSYLNTINQMLNPSLDASPIKQNQNFNRTNQSGYNLDLKSYESSYKSKQNSKKSIEEERKPSSKVSYDQLRNLLWK